MNTFFRRSLGRLFGTYPLKGETLASAVTCALATGYRAFDTAQMYGNEKDLGDILANGAVPREDLYILTKVHPDNFTEDRFIATVEQSLRDLRISKADLLLLHWPPIGGDILPSLALLEKAHRQGLAAEIGVSNYTAAMMRQAKPAIGTPLATNQVEFHPLLDQSKLLAAAAETGIPLCSYSAIARGEVFKHAIFTELAEAYGRTPAQIVQRWILQKGVVVNSMSTNPDNIRANWNITDFTLSSIDMDRIGRLGAANFRSSPVTRCPGRRNGTERKGRRDERRPQAQGGSAFHAADPRLFGLRCHSEDDLRLEMMGPRRHAFEGGLNLRQRIGGRGKLRHIEPVMRQKRQRVMHVLAHAGDRTLQAVFPQDGLDDIDGDHRPCPGEAKEGDVTTPADQLEGLRIEARSTDTLDHEVGAATIGHRRHGLAQCVQIAHSSVGARVLRHLAARFGEIEGDDRCSPHKPHHLDMEIADGTGTQYHHGTSEPHIRLARRAHHAGHGFREGCHFGRHACRNRDHQPLGHGDVFGKGAIPCDAHLLHLGAGQDFVPPAPEAGSAADIDIHHDALPGRKALRFPPGLDDQPRELMSGHQRQAIGGIMAMEDVKISAADSGAFDLDQNLARPGHGHGPGFDFEPLRRNEDGSLHRRHGATSRS